MNLEKTSHWITILGNAGLLIGVALVIFQINQNSQLVREQLSQARWTDDLNLHLAMMGENPAAAVAKAIENPSALSVEDSRVLEAYDSGLLGHQSDDPAELDSLRVLYRSSRSGAWRGWPADW